MLDRCLQLASSPEERCVEFLVYDMSVFITCENPLLLPSFSVSSLPNFLVFLSSSSSSSYFSSPLLLFFPLSSSSSYPSLLLFLPHSPPPPSTPLSSSLFSSSSYPPLLPPLLFLLPPLLLPPTPPPLPPPLSSSSSYPSSSFSYPSSSSYPPPPPTPLSSSYPSLLFLFISPAILVTCVKQYSTCDLSTWRREERGSPKSPMTFLSSGWVTTFPSWLTAAPNHSSLLLLERYVHFILIK